MSTQVLGPRAQIVDLDLPPDLQFVSGPPTARNLRSAVQRIQLKRLAMRGLNAKQAAQALGCGIEAARRYYRDPEFRREVLSCVNGAFEDVDAAFTQEKVSLHERLGDVAEKSFEILERLLEDPETQVHHKIKIAQDFMDRNPESQAGHVVRTGAISDPDTLAVAARTAREVEASMDKIVPIRKGA